MCIYLGEFRAFLRDSCKLLFFIAGIFQFAAAFFLVLSEFIIRGIHSSTQVPFDDPVTYAFCLAVLVYNAVLTLFGRVFRESALAANLQPSPYFIAAVSTVAMAVPLFVLPHGLNYVVVIACIFYTLSISMYHLGVRPRYEYMAVHGPLGITLCLFFRSVYYTRFAWLWVILATVVAFLFLWFHHWATANTLGAEDSATGDSTAADSESTSMSGTNVENPFADATFFRA